MTLAEHRLADPITMTFGRGGRSSSSDCQVREPPGRATRSVQRCSRSGSPRGCDHCAAGTALAPQYKLLRRKYRHRAITSSQQTVWGGTSKTEATVVPLPLAIRVYMASTEWNFEKKHIKGYPHFDAHISLEKAAEIAFHPTLVTKHAFFPFILFTSAWNKYAKKGGRGKPKSRPIRYAARSDAYIYTYYRHILSSHYERLLSERNLSASVLAYRKIVDPRSGQGQCNVDFAKKAFDAIGQMEKSVAVALDISDFFGSIDHSVLKQKWCDLLKVDRLPSDHFAVFKAITKYSTVEKLALYERLGFYGVKHVSPTGTPIPGYLVNYKDIRPQLCSGAEFREKIAGGNGQQSLIRPNRKAHGIPQGAPISDLLANLYLVDYDSFMYRYCADRGGVYFRYSDDILLILPGDKASGQIAMRDARNEIKKYGSKIKIKEEKCQIYTFDNTKNRNRVVKVQGDGGGNGLEYLGFRYDGRKIYLRDSTVSNLMRKISRNCRSEALRARARYKGKSAHWVKQKIDYNEVISRFLRVKDFELVSKDHKSWTFWTYAKRARKIMGPSGGPVLNQIKSVRQFTKHRLDKYIDEMIP